MNQHTNILSPDILDWRSGSTRSGQPLLSVNGLCITDPAGRTLVEGVSFEVPRGGTLGIVGESGSGKSLTCRAILGVLPPGLQVAAGGIRYDSNDLADLDERGWRKLRRTHLSAVFQDPASYLNPSIPVGKQLAEALRANLHLDRRAAQARAIALLARVGLTDSESVYRQYPFELSGGMAQRVLIAIAVSCGPQLLIADEATTALDVTVQAEVLALLDELRREQGLTLIFVSHDLAVVSRICENVVVMRDGAVLEAGPTAQVLGNPAHAYTRSLIDSHRRFAVAGAGEARPGASPVPSQAGKPLLTIAKLRANYEPRKAVLHGIDLSVNKGEILGLIGETGSGKTTVLRSILGLLTPQGGSIDFEGVALERLRGKELRAFRKSSRIQYVFQDSLRSLDPDLAVGVSIGQGLEIRGGLDGPERAARVHAALEAVGLDPALATRLPRDLSGGQRQRVVFARALILDPALLLLDEPVSGLDAVSRIHVLELMRSLATERGIAQVFISHDLGSIAGIADRVAVLHHGLIVEEGPAHQIITSPVHPYTQRLLQSAPRIDFNHPQEPVRLIGTG
jgi:peptide/nickel transport system ATP-binding protein